MIKKCLMSLVLLLVVFVSQAEETNSQFPPNMSKMIADMNLAEQAIQTSKITVYVPRNSYNYTYLEYLNKVNKIIELNLADTKMQEKYLKSLDEEYFYSYRNKRVGLPDSNYLSNINFKDNGFFVDIDTKNSPRQNLEISDLNDNYTVSYNYGHGYLYNTTLKINIESKNRNIINEVSSEDKVKLLNDKFSNYLIKNGFKKESSFFTEFWGEKRFIKENVLVILNCNVFYKGYSYKEHFTFFIEIENIHINKRYEEISKKIKEDVFNKEYKEIQNILK